LNKYPIHKIPTETNPKKIINNLVDITLRSIIASGSDNPAIDIMNAKEVPNGIPA
jgi:hypothetical protein